MTTEEKWTAGKQFAEILLLGRSASLGGSGEVVREPKGKGGRRMRRRRDGGGRVRHEQEEQGKCKMCGVNRSSKERLGEKGQRASQTSGIKSCLSHLSIRNTKESS